MTNPKRCLALDCDGVIINSVQYHIASWKKAIKDNLGIEISSDTIRRSEGIRGVEFIKTIASDHHLTPTDKEIESIYQHKRRIYHSIFKLVPNTGSLDLINKASSLGYGLVLVTSTGPDEVDTTLSGLGIREKFTTIVTHDDVVKGKPDPEPFRLAAQKMAVPPEYCLAIENGPAGITSARTAGLPCLAVATTLNPRYLSQANIVFADLPHLTGWIIKESSQSHGIGPWKF